MSGQESSASLWPALGVGLFGLLVGFLRHKLNGRSRLRSKAMVKFEEWLKTSAASQLGLQPGTAEIVHQSETADRDPANSYTLTLFLRGSDGRYAMFKSTPQGHYVKAVTNTVAKAVLKAKYVPPPDG